MKKHISTLIVLLLIGVGLCSCTSNSLNRFGKTEIIYTKEIVIKYNIQNDTQKPFLEVIRGDGGELCFDNTINPKAGEAITVRASDLKKALDYFYNSKATWNIKRIQKPGHNTIQAYANSEMQIKYEVAYCEIKEIKFFRNDEDTYASFRLVSPPKIVNGDEK